MAASIFARGVRGLAPMPRSTTSAQRFKSGGSALVAVVYVSEGRDDSVVDNLEKAAEDACMKHGARVVNVFRDVEYNRTGFTLGIKQQHPDGQEEVVKSRVVEALRQSALALTERALSLIDLREHSAMHPRCGVVDHISCHAIGDTDDAVAVNLARCLGERIGENLSVPVLLYGLASPIGVQLADLRRKYGYFRETAIRTDLESEYSRGGGWAGAHMVDGGCVDANYGPRNVPPEAGIIMLGATRWVCNYNIPLSVTSISGQPLDRDVVLQAARKVAKMVSERGGGLPAVQAMALLHGDGDGATMSVEVACNLLDVALTDPAAVQAEVRRLCGKVAVPVDLLTWKVESGYQTNLTPDRILAQLEDL